MLKPRGLETAPGHTFRVVSQHMPRHVLGTMMVGRSTTQHFGCTAPYSPPPAQSEAQSLASPPKPTNLAHRKARAHSVVSVVQQHTKFARICFVALRQTAKP
eukprot:8487915-Pyramimonas_sp.AAC.3